MSHSGSGFGYPRSVLCVSRLKIRSAIADRSLTFLQKFDWLQKVTHKRIKCRQSRMRPRAAVQAFRVRVRDSKGRAIEAQLGFDDCQDLMERLNGAGG
jgi:hypothetical protein